MFFMLPIFWSSQQDLYVSVRGAMALVMKSFRIEEGVYEINDSGVNRACFGGIKEKTACTESCNRNTDVGEIWGKKLILH